MKCRAVVVEALVHVGAKLQMVLEKLYLAIMRCCVEGHSISRDPRCFRPRPSQFKKEKKKRKNLKLPREVDYSADRIRIRN